MPKTLINQNTSAAREVHPQRLTRRTRRSGIYERFLAGNLTGSAVWGRTACRTQARLASGVGRNIGEHRESVVVEWGIRAAPRPSIRPVQILSLVAINR